MEQKITIEYKFESEPTYQSNSFKGCTNPIEATIKVVDGKYENVYLRTGSGLGGVLAVIPPKFLRELADKIEELDK